MSASMVSATRRRTSSTVNDVKQSVEIVNTTAAAATTNVNDANELITATKVTPPIKNTSSKIRTQNRKMTSSKHGKLRWKRIVSVVVKNVLLGFVIIGLVQMVKNFVVKDDDLGNGRILGFSDMEGRISAVESWLKTTSKMLQVQVEVVDKKIDSEVGNLRREIGKRVEDKSVEIEGKLIELGKKTEDLGVGLNELKEISKDFVLKENVVRLFDEYMSGKGGNELSLDEIRALAREVVENEIEKHAADGLGRVDYALGSGGAKVAKHSEPFVVGKSWFVGTRDRVHENAARMLSPSFGEPGMCFPLKGSNGFLQIRLRNAIVPEAVTLEHVAMSVAYDQSSAPKDCRIFGWLHDPRSLETDLIVNIEKILLAEFTYDLEKSNAQTINTVNSASSAVIDTVSFEFSSNHGSPTHTCIYRLRVHGHLPDPVPKIA